MLEIPLCDSWGEDCSVKQVNDQARNSVRKLVQLLQQHDDIPRHLPRGTRVVSMDVKTVIAQSGRS